MPPPSLRNLVVNFDLPFVLRLADSIEKKSVPEGYEHYIVHLGELPAMLRFQKKVRDLGGVQIATEDRRGLLSYSTVQVWFDRKAFLHLPIRANYRERAPEFLHLALAFVNRFVDVYRTVTGSFWLQTVRARDVASVTFIGLGEDGAKDSFLMGTLGTGLALGSIVRDKDDEGLRRLLAEGYTPDELQRLAYVVAALFDQEEYWSAALAAEILFEAKVSRILRHHFAQQGLSPSDTEARFDRPDGTPRSVTNLLKTYVLSLARVDPEDATTPLGQKWQPWFNDARGLRNEVAHGRSIEVSQAQARDALTAVAGFLSELEKLLPDVRPTEIIIH